MLDFIELVATVNFLELATKHEITIFTHASCVVKALNHFTCNIAYVPLPLGCEIFIDKKHDQVETNDHVFMICK